MNFLTRIAVLFYVTIILFLSVFILLFVFNYIDVQNVLNLLALIYTDNNLKLSFGVIACVLLLLNFIFYQMFSVSMRKDYTIAFDNPSGRVNVSLLAIEDLVRRAIIQTKEVKEIKSKISASKKGLKIRIKLVLRAEGSIPEVTSRVQDLVKRKVQSAIGLDEPIEVSIFVGKILSEQGYEKRPSKKDEEPKASEPNVPFQGYRA